MGECEVCRAEAHVVCVPVHSPDTKAVPELQESWRKAKNKNKQQAAHGVFAFVLVGVDQQEYNSANARAKKQGPCVVRKTHSANLEGEGAVAAVGGERRLDT